MVNLFQKYIQVSSKKPLSKEVMYDLMKFLFSLDVRLKRSITAKYLIQNVYNLCEGKGDTVEEALKNYLINMSAFNTNYLSNNEKRKLNKILSRTKKLTKGYTIRM